MARARAVIAEASGRGSQSRAGAAAARASQRDAVSAAVGRSAGRGASVAAISSRSGAGWAPRSGGSCSVPAIRVATTRPPPSP
ncbi:hypothetical protein ACFQ60_21060 [Streptomyces zhihengii]